MQFGTGSTTELTKKREGQSTEMPYVRPYIQINIPDFFIFTPVSVVIGVLYRM